MITTNILNRIFHIKFGGGTGTAFTIDRDQKQYLVTAKHVVDGISTGDQIEIFHDSEWKNLSVNVVGIAAGDIDVIVLSPAIQISPANPFEATMGDIILGQSVYFLGFPYAMTGQAEHINNEFPVPLIKAGVVSAILNDAPGIRLLLDGHNNPGFSGGPIVFIKKGRPYRPGLQYTFGAIVHGYPSPQEPIFDQEGSQIGYIQANPGIVVGYDIAYATNLIDANPVGRALGSVEQ